MEDTPVANNSTIENFFLQDTLDLLDGSHIILSIKRE
jgi:hypothetical protein